MRQTVLYIILVLVWGTAGYEYARGEEVPPKIPVSIKADKLDYDRTNDIYTATGNVKIEQGTIALDADKVVLNNATGEAVAHGNVFLKDKADTVRADKLEFNMNTGAGVIYNGQIFMSKGNLHLKGEKIERSSETVYHVENGIFTTCDEEDWYLKARVIDVDLNRYATGRGVSFNMAGLPTFYTPYFLFPVRRQTGLLIPEPGFSSKNGFLLKNQFFWAMSDYRDMTLYSDYRSKQGLGTGIEYRYVNSRDSSGRLFYNYFDSFSRYRLPDAPPDISTGRWEFLYRHSEEFAEDLSARLDLNFVSDRFYYRDLETRIEFRSRPYLDSNAFYVERWDTASLYVLGQYTTDLTRQNRNTIQKLPELRYSIFGEKLAGPVHLNFDGSAANFTRQEGDGIRRADFNPSLAAALGSSGFGFVPRVGFHATFYDRGLVSDEPIERKYFYAGADLNARIFRVYGADAEFGIGRIRHSIETAFSYLYVPEVNQDRPDFPLIDSADLVSGQNSVSASLINRLTAHYRDASGFKTYDMMILKITDVYDFSDDDKNMTATTVVPANSGLKVDLSLRTPKLLSFTGTALYDTDKHRLSSSSENLNVNIENLRFNLSHQITRDPKTEYVIGGVGFKAGKWDLYSQLWRDIELGENTQEDYRAYYSSQCWGIGLAYVSKPGETQYLVTFNLKGIGAAKM